MTMFKSGRSWKGFYQAPSPYGRQEVTVFVNEATPDLSFVLTGQDSWGTFSAKGSLTNIKVPVADSEQEHIGDEISRTCDISFIKHYVDEKGYKGIKHNGKLFGNKITGKYSFVWRASFLSKTDIDIIYNMLLIGKNGILMNLDL